MNITKFRKKPVVIEAVRWSGNNLREVINFTGLHPSANKWSWEEYEQVVAREGLKIFTLEGPLIATEGDWIIRGLRGEYYPCKCDIFEATYDPADATSEHTRLTAEIAEKDAEIERLDRVFHNQGNLREQIFDLQLEIRRLNDLIGNTRLADQEAIERHTRRVVAKDCAEIAEAMWSDHYWAWPAMQICADKIRKKYGVE